MTLRAARIESYVLRQLGFGLVAVTLGLVALIWLTQSLRFVELVVNRGLSFRVFLQLTSLLLPNFVAIILPIAGFVVVLFVYQKLASDRELTVMRGAGLSQFALARPALYLALMAMLTGYALNLYIVPAASSAFREFQFEIRNKVVAFLLQEGVFTPISEQLTVYVRARDRDGTLRGILVDDARNPASHATILAESGRLVMDGGLPRVLLLNGSREELDHRTGRLNVLSFDENAVELADADKGGAQRFRDVSEMSLDELFRPSAIIPDRDRGKLRVEAHRRLANPLTIVSFTIIALAAVLTGTFRRHGSLIRPALAVLVVVALVASGLAVGNLAARQAALVPLVWLHAVVPGLIAGWVLLAPQMTGAGRAHRVAAG